MGLLSFAQTAAAAQALLVAALVLSIGVPLAMIVIWLVRYGSVVTTRTRDAEAAPEGAPIGDRTEDRHWKWSLIYYNRDDPAL